MNLHFDCVFYYVRDLQSAIRFYSDVLGLPLRSRDAIARFDVDGVLLELIPASGETDFSGAGNARLCLNVEDLEQGIGALHQKGVPVGAIHDAKNGRLASFHDPDGNELVLWEYSHVRAA